MAYPDNPEVASSYSFQIYDPDNEKYILLTASRNRRQLKVKKIEIWPIEEEVNVSFKRVGTLEN